MALLHSGIGNISNLDTNDRIANLEARVRAQENNSVLNVPVPVPMIGATARIASIDEDGTGGNEVSVASLRAGNEPTKMVVVGNYVYIINYADSSISVLKKTGIKSYSVVQKAGLFDGLMGTMSDGGSIGHSRVEGYRPVGIFATPNGNKIVVVATTGVISYVCTYSPYVSVGNPLELNGSFKVTADAVDAAELTGEGAVSNSRIILTSTSSGNYSALLSYPFTATRFAGTGHVVANNSDSSFAYIGSPTSTNFKKFDMVNNTISSANLPGSFHDAVAVSPDNLYVYVSAASTEVVYKLNASTLALITTHDIDAAGFYFEFSTDTNKVYVACPRDDSVKIINISENTVAEIPVLDTPHRLKANYARSRIYVVGYPSSDLSKIDVIDTNTNQLINSVYTSYNPTEVAILADDSSIFVSIQQRDSVDVFEFNESVNMNLRADMGFNTNYGDVAIVRANNASVTVGATYDASYGINEPPTYNSIDESLWRECWHGFAWFIPYSGLVIRVETQKFATQEPVYLRARILTEPGEYVSYYLLDGSTAAAAIPQVVASYFLPKVHTEGSVITGNLTVMPPMPQYIRTAQENHTAVTWMSWVHGAPQYKQVFGTEAGATLNEASPATLLDDSAFGQVYQQSYSISIDAALAGTTGYVQVLKPSVWWATPATSMLGWQYGEEASDADTSTAVVPSYNPAPTASNPEQMGIFPVAVE